MTEETELPNKGKIRTLGEKETYKYLIILEADTIKHEEMKEKIKKECLWRTRKRHETKLCSRNFIKAIKTWVAHFGKYSGLFLKWTREEIQQIDQRTRKLMMIHKPLHRRDHVGRLYVSGNEEGRRVVSIEYGVDASMQRLKDYI